MEFVTVGNVGLAFLVYPVALAKLPFAVKLFSVLFFLALLLLGIDSAFSLLETVATAINDKFRIGQSKATGLVALGGLLLGLPFTTCAGLYWVSLVDHYVMYYVVTLVAIFECVAVGWFLGIDKFTAEINANSKMKLGIWFAVFIKYLTPIVLFLILLVTFVKEILSPFGADNNPLSAVLLIGLGTLVFAFGAAFLMKFLKPRT
jgi:NSS family neurotransmitter:Na+ symporter